MGITRSALAACLGLWCIVAASARADDGKSTRPATATRGVHASGAAASAPGFTIERTPAWVRPVAYDPAAPVPTAPYQILVADEQTRVQAGGSVRYRHYMRRVNDTSALQQGGQIEIDFDPSYQRLVFHKIDILRGNQRIDKLDARKIHLLQREQQLERQVVDGRVTASIVLDDLRAGDRIEWATSVVGDNPVFAGRFVDDSWDAYANAPIGIWQLRVLAPATRNIHTRVGDPAIVATDTVHDGVREMLFKRGNVEQQQIDGHLPPTEYLKQQIELSEFDNWQDVSAWSAQLFAKAMQASPAVDAQVAALKAGASDPTALLRATLDFVQHDIRYFGTESGIDSHQPASADTVLRQRFGDCKDKVALLAELLGRLGFDATPVLVSANYQAATRQRLPGPLAFDHAIVRVMVDGKPVFLDATRSLQTGAVTAREALDLGFGLLARNGESELTPLPDGRDTVRTETTETFDFPKLTQEGTLTSVTILHGALAEWLRAGLASQPRAELEKAISADTLRVYPSLVASAPVDFETTTEDNTVKVTAHYRTGDFWTLPEQRTLVSRYVLGTLIAPLRLPDQGTRTQPYRLPPPGRYLHRVAFDFGKPFPTGVPNSSRFDETNAIFDLHVRADSQSPHQEVSGELRLLTDTVLPGDWQSYRDKLNKIAPKLVGAIAVSPLSVEQQASLRPESEALLTKLRKGELRAVTPTQATARMKLLVFDKELASDRLPPNLRAQVLLAKGEQLDYVDQPHAAEEAFEAALRLDPANADMHEALAINAVFRNDAATALGESDEALRLAPARTRPYFIRGYTHYLGGDMAAARTDFTAALQARDEVEHSYGAIWLYLATRRGGGDGVQAVHGLEPTASAPDWPYSVLQLMEGRIALDAALEASHENGQRSPSRECELYYYAGEKALADGDLSAARKYLRLSMATGVTEFTEYQMARRELAHIGDR